MALDISDADVLARFDMLVENGIIYYGPTNSIPLLNENFPVSLLQTRNVPPISTHVGDLYRIVTVGSLSFRSVQHGRRSQ